MFKTIFLLPAAIRLFNFSRRELLSSPSTMRPSSSTTDTPFTSLSFMVTDMLVPPPARPTQRQAGTPVEHAATRECGKKYMFLGRWPVRAVPWPNPDGGLTSGPSYTAVTPPVSVLVPPSRQFAESDIRCSRPENGAMGAAFRGFFVPSRLWEVHTERKESLGLF